MNWITKALSFGEKIKKVLKKRPSKEDIANSDWTSCCKGPILKKDLEENLWVCNSCGKHHRINCRQRFDIIFGKNTYEIPDTPISAEDPGMIGSLGYEGTVQPQEPFAFLIINGSVPLFLNTYFLFPSELCAITP